MSDVVNPEIQELRRLAEDADARSAAKWAAASIAWAHDIKGSCDPAYIANVIEGDLRRFEGDPDAPLVERPWRGLDAITGWGMDDFVDWAEEAEASQAARSAAIGIVRAYGGHYRGDSAHEFRKHVVDVAERIQQYLDIPEQPPEVTEALAAINVHRRVLGMSPLDPERAGWSDEDVVIEAERVARLPNLGRLMP